MFRFIYSGVFLVAIAITFPGDVLLAIWLLARSRCLEVLDGPSA